MGSTSLASATSSLVSPPATGTARPCPVRHTRGGGAAVRPCHPNTCVRPRVGFPKGKDATMDGDLRERAVATLAAVASSDAAHSSLAQEANAMVLHLCCALDSGPVPARPPPPSMHVRRCSQGQREGG